MDSTFSIGPPPSSSPIIDGKFQFGRYNAPFKTINFLAAKSPYKFDIELVKRVQLREWQAFQIGNKDYFFMMAIYNAKKLALVQFIVYDIKNNKKIHYEKKVPAWKLQVPNTLYGGKAAYKSPDFSIEAINDLDKNSLSITVTIKGFKKLPNITATFDAQHAVKQYTPMVVCLPFSEKRAMYSHKCLMPVKGSVRINQELIQLEKEASSLIIDDHKGYYPFPTRYDWVTAMGWSAAGDRLGFNLTHNQVLDPETYNENCLWKNGELHPLPAISVSRPQGYKGAWYIKDKHGMVDLEFKPIVHTAVDVNLLLFRSKYQGPYGFFDGFIKDKEGNKVAIDHFFGMGEDFYLRI